MKKTIALMGLGLVLSSAAHAASVSCSTKLIFVVGTGATEARATLSFTPSVSASGVVSIQNVKGSLEFPDYLNSTFAQAAANAAEEYAQNVAQGYPDIRDNNLVGGTIDQAVANANTAYRPRVYTDSYQFKRLNTVDMPGYTEGLMDYTLMIPQSAFGTSTADFKATAQVQIDQNAGRVVYDCKFQN